MKDFQRLTSANADEFVKAFNQMAANRSVTLTASGSDKPLRGRVLCRRKSGDIEWVLDGRSVALITSFRRGNWYNLGDRCIRVVCESNDQSSLHWMVFTFTS